MRVLDQKEVDLNVHSLSESLRRLRFGIAPDPEILPEKVRKWVSGDSGYDLQTRMNASLARLNILWNPQVSSVSTLVLATHIPASQQQVVGPWIQAFSKEVSSAPILSLISNDYLIQRAELFDQVVKSQGGFLWSNGGQIPSASIPFISEQLVISGGYLYACLSRSLQDIFAAQRKNFLRIRGSLATIFDGDLDCELSLRESQAHLSPQQRANNFIDALRMGSGAINCNYFEPQIDANSFSFKSVAANGKIILWQIDF